MRLSPMPAEAQTIGMTVVEERLAACVNILQPCRSIYRWEGAIETSTETPALFKTTLDKADALIARIKELHSYDIPGDRRLADRAAAGGLWRLGGRERPVIFYPSETPAFA